MSGVTPYKYDSVAQSNFATFNAWIASLGSAPTKISIGDTALLTADLVIPVNIDIAEVTIAGNFDGPYNLTINKMSAKPMHQIFTANLTSVTLSAGAVDFVSINWFGGNGSASATAAYNTTLSYFAQNLNLTASAEGSGTMTFTVGAGTTLVLSTTISLSGLLGVFINGQAGGVALTGAKVGITGGSFYVTPVEVDLTVDNTLISTAGKSHIYLCSNATSAVQRTCSIDDGDMIDGKLLYITSNDMSFELTSTVPGSASLVLTKDGVSYSRLSSDVSSYPTGAFVTALFIQKLMPGTIGSWHWVLLHTTGVLS